MLKKNINKDIWVIGTLNQSQHFQLKSGTPVS